MMSCLICFRIVRSWWNWCGTTSEQPFKQKKKFLSYLTELYTIYSITYIIYNTVTHFINTLYEGYFFQPLIVLLNISWSGRKWSFMQWVLLHTMVLEIWRWANWKINIHDEGSQRLLWPFLFHIITHKIKIVYTTHSVMNFCITISICL